MARQTILSNGSIVYRTALLPIGRAYCFAKCLRGNSRFEEVETFESLASPGRYFITFRPSSFDRQISLISNEHNARMERAQTEGMNYMFWPDPDCIGSTWCFNPKSGETYQVSKAECTCPDFEFRCKPAGLYCKHMITLESGRAV